MSRRSIKELPVDQATAKSSEIPETPAAQSSLSARMTAVLEHGTDKSEQSPVPDSLGKSWWNNVVDVVMGRDEASDRSPTDDDFAALPDMDAARPEPMVQPMPYTLAGADDGAPNEVYRPRAMRHAVPQYEVSTDLAADLSERRHGLVDGIDAINATEVAEPTLHREPSSSMWGLIGAVLALLTVLLAGLAFVLGQRSASNNSVVQPTAVQPGTSTVTSVATTVVTTTATATATKVVLSTPPASTVTTTPPVSTTTVTTTVTPPPPPASTVIRTQTQTVQVPDPSTQVTEATQATDAPAATDTTQ